MGHTTILCGSHRSERAKAITKIFIESYPESVFIVPTYYFAVRKKVALIHEVFQKGFIGNAVYDFTHFVQELLLAEGLPIKRLEHHEETLIIRQIISDPGSESHLQVFPNLSKPESLVPHCAQLIHNLKQAGITPEEFLQRIPNEGIQKWDRFVGWVYQRYQQILLSNHWYDVPGLFWEAEIICNRCTPKLLYGKKVILFDGFDDFTYSEIRLIQSLVPHVDAIVIGLNYDPSPTRNDVYQIAHEAIENLKKLLDPEIKFLETDSPRSAINFIAENLFWRDKPKQYSSFEFESEITITPYRNRFEEIREIARGIKKLIVDKEVAPQKIALVYRQIEPVRDIIERTLKEFGLPYIIQQPFPLRETVLGGWLELWFTQLTQQKFSGLIPLLYHPLTGTDPRIREALFLVMNSYHISEEELIDTVLDRITREVSNYDKSGGKKTNISQDVLINLKDELQRWQTWRDCFRRCHNTTEFIRITQELIREGLAKAQFFSIAKEEIEVFNKISVLQKMINKVYDSTPMSIGSFSQLMIDMIRECTVHRSTGFTSGIVCCDIPGVRNLSFDYIFLGGLEEGSIPLKYSANALYTEDDLSHLRRLGLPIDNFRIHTQREWLFFQQVFESAQKGVYLSYVNYSETHEERQPSLFLRELIELCNHLGLDPLNTTKSEPDASTKLIFPCSKRELKDVELTILREAAEAKYPDEYKRWWALTQRENNEKNIFTGQIVSDEQIQWIVSRLSDHYKFSVEQIETFRKCPYLFFIQRVLGLDEWEELLIEPSPLYLGSWAHLVLQQLLKEHVTTLFKDNEASTILSSILSTVFETELTKGIFSDALLRITKERLFRILHNFINSQNFLVGVPNNWRPTHFEVSFGLSDVSRSESIHKPMPFVMTAGPYKIPLSGRIDRIDVRSDFANSVRIIDYKWGDLPTQNNIQNYVSIQLQLYTIVTEQYLLKGASVENALFLSIKDHRKREVVGGKSKLSKPDIEENLSKVLREMMDKIHKGDFSMNVEPESNSDMKQSTVQRCEHCRWKDACRYTPPIATLSVAETVSSDEQHYEE